MGLDVTYVLGLGDFAINWKTLPTKEKLFRHILLDIIGSSQKESTSIGEWQSRLEVAHSIKLESQEVLRIVTDLVDSGLVKPDFKSKERDRYTISERGRDELKQKNIQYESLLAKTKEWFEIAVEREKTAYDKELMFTVFLDLLFKAATRSSELLLCLLENKDVEVNMRVELDINYLIKRTKEIFYDISSEEVNDLVESFQRLFLSSVAHDKTLREIFFFLAYGSGLQYLLSRTPDLDLQEYFRLVRSDISRAIILLDTNAIIALLCHADPKNLEVNSLFDLIRQTDEPKVHLAYLGTTISELDSLMRKLSDYAEIIEMVDPRDREEVLEADKRVYLFKSPILAYLIEARYRDWKHYLSQFWESWRRAQSYYNIVDVRHLRKDDNEIFAEAINRYEQFASQYKKFKGMWELFDKTPKNARHDFLLLFYTLGLRSRLAKESLAVNAWCFTLDHTFFLMQKKISTAPLCFFRFTDLNSYLHLLKIPESSINTEGIMQFTPVVYGDERLRKMMIMMHTKRKELVSEGKPFISKDEAKNLLLERIKLHQEELTDED
ncbi:MAG: hypothetical protein H3Z53_11330 [archaeon]|nr:hypothetical protein [archaeon]MCP8314944.1 hypothetical protein [archaeon]